MWSCEALKYLKPENVKITIIAEWQGLIPFSQKEITTSMRKVFDACGGKCGKSGELYEWLHRGILLIPYTDNIDIKFIDKLPGPLYLWGRRAGELIFTKEARRYKHPQNTGIWDFKFDNFNWNIIPTIVCATDGSCKGNGKTWAYGGYACIFDDDRFENIGATMKRCEYTEDGWNEEKYMAITNIRAEMLACYIALKTIFDRWEEADLTIITDNIFVYDLFAGKRYFNLWGEGYLQKKNPDLLKLLRPYLGKFNIIHQEAHIDNPQTKEEIMNHQADKLANKWCIKL